MTTKERADTLGMAFSQIIIDSVIAAPLFVLIWLLVEFLKHH